MKNVFWGVFWIGVYLALVLTPLIALLLGETPGGVGFWWDFSIGLGFAGLAMMGVQFILTARFRRATAPYGIDIIYYFHRYLAVIALALVLAHPLILIVLNPTFLHLLNPLEAPWHMTAGVISAAAMILLVATSLWRKQLRIHYDGWRIAHVIFAISAMVFALIHVEKVGYYIAAPWKRNLWTLIVICWIAVIVYVRLIKPWWISRRPYRVFEVRPERGDSWTVALEPDGHDGIEFESGQFVWLTLRHSPFAMKEHPFSISSSPTLRGRLEFTIKELGDFTRTIKDVAPGETAYVDGPFGAFSVDRHDAPGYVFIAGGIGIAPIASMLRALADRRDARPLILFSGHSSWDRATLRESVEELKERLDLRIVHVLEEPHEGWDGETGYLNAQMLDRHLPSERTDFEYFICGPVPMIEAVERSLHELGIPMSKYHTELFDLV